MDVRADFREERFVRLIVGAAAQIAILAQPRFNVQDKGYCKVGLLKHRPRSEHDGVREGLLAELAHEIGPVKVACRPFERRKKVLAPQTRR